MVSVSGVCSAALNVVEGRFRRRPMPNEPQDLHRIRVRVQDRNNSRWSQHSEAEDLPLISLEDLYLSTACLERSRREQITLANWCSTGGECGVVRQSQCSYRLIQEFDNEVIVLVVQNLALPNRRKSALRREVWGSRSSLCSS